MIVGTAEVLILANDSEFEASLKAGTATSFNSLANDASSAGTNTGNALRNSAQPGFVGLGSDAEKAGTGVGEDLRSAAAPGLAGLSQDMGSAGNLGGTALRTEANTGFKDLTSDIASVGSGATLALRQGTDPGMRQFAIDAGTTGELAGSNLRQGMVNVLEGNASSVSSAGFKTSLEQGTEPGFTALRTDATTAGELAGQQLVTGINTGSKGLSDSLGEEGTAGGTALRTGIGSELGNLPVDVAITGATTGGVLTEQLAQGGTNAGNALTENVSSGTQKLEQLLAESGTQGSASLTENLLAGGASISAGLAAAGAEGSRSLNAALAAGSELAGKEIGKAAEIAQDSISGALGDVPGEVADDLSEAGTAGGEALKASLPLGVQDAYLEARNRWKDGNDHLVKDLGDAGTDAEVSMREALGHGFDYAASDAAFAGSKIGGDLTKGVQKGTGMVSNILGMVGINLGTFSSSAEKAGSSIETAGKKTDEASGFFNELGKVTLIGGITALAAFSAASLKSGVDYQKSVATLSAQADIPVKSAQAIGTAFLHSGSDVVYSAQQQVGALTGVAGQLTLLNGHTLTTAQNVAFMTKAQDLAEESGSSLNSTTSALADTMQKFQMPLKGAASASTDLFNTSRITGSSLSTLSSTVDSLKSKLGATAPSLSDLSALLVDAHEHGMSAAGGIRTLNSAVTTLLKPTEDSAKAQTALKTSFAALSPSLIGNVSGANQLTAANQQLVAATAALPPQLQGVAQAYENGSATTKEIDAATKGLTISQQAAWKAFTSSSAAVKDANTTATSLTPNLQKLATEYEHGSLTAAQVSAATKDMTTSQAAAWKQFVTSDSAISKTNQSLTNAGITVTNAKGQFVGFGSVIGQIEPKLKGLDQAQQLAVLSTDLGTTANKSLLSTVLAGPAAFDKASKAVTDAAAAHHALVVQQQTLAHEFDAVKVQVTDLGTRFGEDLLPYVRDALGDFSHFISFLDAHKPVLIGIAAAIGVVLAGAVAVFAINTGVKMVESTGKAIESVGKLGKALFTGGDAIKGMAKELGGQNDVLAESSTYFDKAVNSTLVYEDVQQSMIDTTKSLSSSTSLLSENRDMLASNSDILAEAEGALSGKFAATSEAVDGSLGSLVRATEATEAYAGGTRAAGEAAGSAAGPISEFAGSLDKATTNAGLLADQSKVLAGAQAASDEALATSAAAADSLAASYGVLEEASASLATVGPEAGEAIAVGIEEADAALETTGIGELLQVIGLALLPLIAIGEELKDHWRGVATGLGDAWHAIDSTAHTVFGDVFNFLKKWGVDILAVFVPFVGIPLLIATHWHKIESDTKAIFGDILSFLKSVPGKIFDAWETFTPEGEFLKHWTTIKHDAVAAWDDIVSFFDSIPNKIEKVFESAGTWLEKAGTSILHGLWTGILADVSEIESIGSKAQHWVLSGVEGAGTWLLSIGKDIITGLIHGLEDEAKDVEKTVSNIGHSIVSVAKSILGVFSPSTVFHEIGANVMKGLANGIKENSQLAAAELKALNLGNKLLPELTKIGEAALKMGVDLKGAAAGLTDLDKAGMLAEHGVEPVVGAIQKIAKALSETGNVKLPASLTADLKSLATLATAMQPGPITAAIHAIYSGFLLLAGGGGALEAGVKKDDIALKAFATTLTPVDEATKKLSTTLTSAVSSFEKGATEAGKIDTAFTKADTAAGKLGTELTKVENELRGMNTAVTSSTHALGTELVKALEDDVYGARLVAPAFNAAAVAVDAGAKKVKQADGDWQSFGKAVGNVLGNVHILTTDIGKIATGLTTSQTKAKAFETELAAMAKDSILAGEGLTILGRVLVTADPGVVKLSTAMKNGVASLTQYAAGLKDSAKSLDTYETGATKAEATTAKWNTQLKDGVTASNTFNNSLVMMTGVSQLAGAAIVSSMTNVKTNGLDFLRTNLGTFVAYWQAEWVLAQTVLQTFQSTTQSTFNQIKSNGLDQLKTETDTLKSTWQSDWSSIESSMSGVWSSMAGTFSNIQSQGLGPLGTEVDSLKTKWNADWSSMASAVSSAFPNPSQALYATGQQLDQGLINGLNSESGNVSTTIGKVVSNAVTAAQTAAGTHSPSTITHDIGRNLMVGLANGIADNAGLPTIEIARVATAVAGTPFHVQTPGTAEVARAIGAIAGNNAAQPAAAQVANEQTITIQEGAFQVHLHGAVDPSVAAAATSGVKSGLAALTSTLQRGSNPGRGVPS